jgi:hypothetical protein
MWCLETINRINNPKNRWWYFTRDGNTLTLAKNSFFTHRPIDAAPAKGNPHTPWYQDCNHHDENHVHVEAKSLPEALYVAYKRIKS